MASAVNSKGYREILGIFEGAKEDKFDWSTFWCHLVDRGLKGVQLVISGDSRSLRGGIGVAAAEELHHHFLPIEPQKAWTRGSLGKRYATVRTVPL